MAQPRRAPPPTAAYQIREEDLTSQELFELVASRDYEALALLYGRVGLHAIRHQMAHLEEEKMDDNANSSGNFTGVGGFWQSPSRRSNNSHNNNNHHHHSNNSNRQQQAAMYSQLLRELSLFVTEKEQQAEQEIANHHHNNNNNNNRLLSMPAKKKSKVEVSADAERLLRDAVAAFSDARPPTNFVVYEDIDQEDDDDDALQQHHGARAVVGGGNGGQETQPQGGGAIAEAALEGPPIFDGSVANATPQTGGAGTILHLACALDEPLCLAFGLAMGADARACHTAFRRLMIHEAACNGSIQCLTLLLELGRQYGHTLPQEGNDADAKLPPRLSRHTHNSSSRAFELPFLPRRLDRSEILAPLHLYALSGAPPPPPSAASSSSSSSSMSSAAPLQTERLSRSERSSSGSSFLGKKKKQPPQQPGSGNGADFLTLLQSFRLYAKQVKKGQLSELDAARKVLQLATLSESSKASLARSCAFQQPPVPESMHHRRSSSRQNTTSDGHGNTPLHWAAFKNETECVSLLLSYGANPNARAHPSGWTPLHDAAYSNSMEAVELLIEAGASVDARANSGATPLCFAAQEDSAKSAELLLRKGADLSARCAGGPSRDGGETHNSRFSGYTPLHYCAHYNAKAAARVLLRHPSSVVAMEIPDLNDRLPIHVAVARGSSAVLMELLHAGARVVTRSMDDSVASTDSETASSSNSTPGTPTAVEPSTPRARVGSNGSNAVVVSTPVSSPVLRSMIPSQPVTSTKPWNCLTQQSIDECRRLIHEAELHWSMERHSLFTPADRRAVRTLLMTGKRLEQSHGMFLDLWPQVLSFCGRGWFDPIDPSQAPTVILPDDTNTTPSALFYNSSSSTSSSPSIVSPGQAEEAMMMTTATTVDMATNTDEDEFDDSLTLPNL